MKLQKYDVLQVSYDAGVNWYGFLTLRAAEDFQTAEDHVRNPQKWAQQDGANGHAVRFRVVRPDDHSVVMDEATLEED